MRHAVWVAVLVFALVGTVCASCAPAAIAQSGNSSAADPESLLGDAVLISTSTQPVVGPLQASYDLASGDVESLSSGVQLGNGYAQFSYTVPPATIAGAWIAAFRFWDDGQGDYYEISVRDWNGALKWGLLQFTSQGSEIVQTGDLDAGTIDLTPGADHMLSLVVYEGIVVLAGDDSRIYADVDLAASGVGDIAAEAGFLADDQATTQTLPMSLSDFSVWDLSSLQANVPTVVALPTSPAATAPVLPPVYGTSVLGAVFDKARHDSIEQSPLVAGRYQTFYQTADLFSWEPGDVNVSDFYTIVTFTNPTDISALSDFGIGFRAADGIETGFRVVVRSNGAWYFEMAGQGPSDQGTAAGLDQLPGVTNTIELLVQGGTAIVAINGVVQSPVDVSSILTPGDVYLGSGFLGGDTVAGREVPYQDWWIYPLSV